MHLESPRSVLESIVKVCAANAGCRGVIVVNLCAISRLRHTTIAQMGTKQALLHSLQSGANSP